jgi:2-dehydropantoate 2-reductase
VAVRVAVIGAGAVGGYFGGRLARAGEEVTFIARGATLTALREEGLAVESIDGDFTVRPVVATDDPAAVGIVDVVLFTVKAWQVADAAAMALPLFGSETVALPLENGVEAPAVLATAVGEPRTLGGLCKIFAKSPEPGRVQHLGVEPSIDFGELDGRQSRRVERIRQMFENAGVRARVPENIHAAMWEKFLFIVPTSAVGAVTRATLGELRDLTESRALLEEATREVWRLARARGVPVHDDAVERTLAFVDKLPFEATASMHRDIVAGLPSELESQSGAVVRLAAQSGVDVPVNRFLYSALLPAERKARGA